MQFVFRIIRRHRWQPSWQAGIRAPSGECALFSSMSMGFGFTNKAVFTVCCGAHEYSCTTARLSVSPWKTRWLLLFGSSTCVILIVSWAAVGWWLDVWEGWQRWDFIFLILFLHEYFYASVVRENMYLWPSAPEQWSMWSKSISVIQLGEQSYGFATQLFVFLQINLSSKFNWWWHISHHAVL